MIRDTVLFDDSFKWRVTILLLDSFLPFAAVYTYDSFAINATVAYNDSLFYYVTVLVIGSLISIVTFSQYDSFCSPEGFTGQ